MDFFTELEALIDRAADAGTSMSEVLSELEAKAAALRDEGVEP